MTGTNERSDDSPAPPQVFVDVTGARRRGLRRVAHLLTVLAVGYVALVAVSLWSGPAAPHSPPFGPATTSPSAAGPGGADVVERSMEPRSVVTDVPSATGPVMATPIGRSPNAQPHPRSTDRSADHASRPANSGGQADGRQAGEPVRRPSNSPPTPKQRPEPAEQPSSAPTSASGQPDDEPAPSPDGTGDGLLGQLLDGLRGP